MDILFLGDSITDCGHCFTEDNLGNGYVKYVSGQLHSLSSNIRPQQPDKTTIPFWIDNFTITNGGTDGFTFPRILQKWQAAYSQSCYNIVVIAGGINDVSIMMDTGLTSRQSIEYLRYSMGALQQLISLLCSKPTGKIWVLEPFLFSFPDYLSLWMPCLHEVCRNIRQTVNSFGTDTVQCFSAQAELDRLVSKNGVSKITTDGIHLTFLGHECLGRIVTDRILGQDCPS